MASASELKAGSCFLYKGEVVKVSKKELVAYGTHSHTKLKLFVEYLFTKKQDVITLAHQDAIELVDVIKKKATVVSLNPLQIMDSVSYETLNAEAGSEIFDTINEDSTVIFVDYKGKVKIIEKVN
jgi:translation elongation factor P/translation initiation factor 5A